MWGMERVLKQPNRSMFLVLPLVVRSEQGPLRRLTGMTVHGKATTGSDGIGHDADHGQG